MQDLQTGKLTERQANILRAISEVDGFITFSTLARNESVSSRTIIRELDECERWLNTAGIALERRAGLGIRLVDREQSRRLIEEILNTRSIQSVLSMTDRLLFLRQVLLRESEPVKLFTLNRQLKAAESTISGDLERLEPWFSAHGLVLVRKPGLGVYIEGPETNRRKALKALLNEVLNENSLIELMMHPQDSAIYKRLHAVFLMNERDFDNVRNLVQIVEVWEKHHQLIHRERNFLNMILSLFVLTWRQNQPAEAIPVPDAPPLKLLAIANSLLEETAMTLGLPWLLREVTMVAVQLSMHYPELTTDDPLSADRSDIDAETLARQMIALIQGETGYAIHDEDDLIGALTTHLQLALTRLKFNQTIHNPLEKEIRDNYPKWFELAGRCAALIEQSLKKAVPDAETAYLTMYLGAAMEKAAAQSERRYHIAVLCPAGMSSSVLLASRVEGVFPQVKVDAIISFHQAAEIIQQHRFDMILTTAYIVLPGIPILTVRPFFPKEDQEKLRHFLTTLVPRIMPRQASGKADLRTQLGRMNDLVSGLYSLLTHFFFVECDCASMEGAIQLTARQVHPDNPAAFAEALGQREALGHVLLEEQHMALIHARSAAVSQLHFGLIRLKNPMRVEQTTVANILVMAAPLSVAPVKLDIMRLISRSVIDDGPFGASLQTGSEQEIYQHLERILRNHVPMGLPDLDDHDKL